MLRKIFTNKVILYILGIVLLIGLWFIISLSFSNSRIIFPDPISTFKRAIELLGMPKTYKYLWFSVVRLFAGFLLSLFIAFLLGMLVNTNDHLYNLLTPAMTFLKSAPTATFVFLFIMLLAAKNAPILVVFTVTMPILYESIVGGLRNTDKEIIAAAQIDGASKLKTLLKVQLPLSMPVISIGIASTFGMAFKIEIMAEIITGYTNGGIGSMIRTSQILKPADLTDMFAYSLLAIILILIITIIASFLKSKTIPIVEHRSSYGA